MLYSNLRFHNQILKTTLTSSSIKKHVPKYQNKLKCKNEYGFENVELLIGDCLTLTSFCMYKQTISIITHPDFPGWTAPLHFNPTRFIEFFSFLITVTGTWIITSYFFGNYKIDSTSNLSTSVTRTILSWLTSMPVAASQLVLLVAIESHSLIGSESFGTKLPLTVIGMGEPFVTASGILLLMLLWRSFYVTYLDIFGRLKAGTVRYEREKEMGYFNQAIITILILCLSGFLFLEYGEQLYKLMTFQI